MGSKTQHRLLKKFCVVAAEQGTTFLTKQMTALSGLISTLKMLHHAYEAQLAAARSGLDTISFKHSSQLQLEEMTQASLNSILQNLQAGRASKHPVSCCLPYSSPLCVASFAQG